MEHMMPYLDLRYQILETDQIRESCGRWNPVLTLDAVQDEYAIAAMMYDMREYLESGREIYPLADALEDAYMFTLIHKAAVCHGDAVVSEEMPWHR